MTRKFLYSHKQCVHSPTLTPFDTERELVQHEVVSFGLHTAQDRTDDWQCLQKAHTQFDCPDLSCTGLKECVFVPRMVVPDWRLLAP